MTAAEALADVQQKLADLEASVAALAALLTPPPASPVSVPTGSSDVPVVSP